MISPEPLPTLTARQQEEMPPLPLLESLREVHLEPSRCYLDPSSLNWHPRLSPAPVPLLVMRAPEFVCKIGGGGVSLDEDGNLDSRKDDYQREERFAWLPAGFATVQIQVRVVIHPG
jgi:hypothetical protein